MTTKELSCQDRIAERMTSRAEQVGELVKQADSTGYNGDEESVYDLALSVETIQHTTICLSYGGPADYLEVIHEGSEISRVTYRFSDWYDTASEWVSPGSPLFNYAQLIIDGIE